MEKQTVENIIINIVSQSIESEPSLINVKSGYLKTFGWDSLAQVRIVSNIEDEFNINIPDDRIMELVTIKELIEYIIGL